jgi:hypothetical protein
MKMQVVANNWISHRKLAGVGLGAFVLLGVLSAANGGGFNVDGGPRVEAGSVSAPVNTVYHQPVVGGMTVGETSTWTPPTVVTAGKQH